MFTAEQNLLTVDFRPVPLRHFYFAPSMDHKIVPLFNGVGGKGLNNAIKPEKRQGRFQQRGREEEKTHVKLVKILNDKDMLPAIYFCFQQEKMQQIS